MTGYLGTLALSLALQTPAPSNDAPWTLDAAIHAAELYSSTVMVAQSDYDAAKARIGEGQSHRLPQVGFSAFATQFDDRTTVTFPGIGLFELAPNNQEELSVVITQDLDVSGQLGLTVAQDRLQASAAAYRLRSTREDQDLTTTVDYYAVLRAEQNVKVAQASLDAYRQQSQIAHRLFEGGVGQKIDALRADSELAEAERELVGRKDELDSARSALNDLLKRPLDAPLTLVEPAVDTKPDSDKPRSALIAEALDKRPEALAASIDVAAAQKGVKIALTGNYPSVALSLSGSRYPTTSFEEPRQNIAALTLSVSVPLYDGGLTRSRVSEARAGVGSAKARQDQTRRAIALQVQDAALDVHTQEKRLEAAEVALVAATAARKLAEQRFESQVGIYSEVTDAQSELTAAQAAQVEARFDLLTARARLARSLSRPLTQSVDPSNTGAK